VRSPGGAPAVRGRGAGQEEKWCGSPRRSGVGEMAGRVRRSGVPTVEDGSRGQGQSGRGSPASTLQVDEMTGHVRGGLSGKSEEGCVWAGVLTVDGGDGGATVFREADGGGNGGISGEAAGAARGRGRGELSGAELR
jgi:hypothetical protein